MGIFDMINSFLNPEKGYEAAEKPLTAGWNQAKGYQEPFTKQGIEEYGTLHDAEGRLLNPADLEADWAKSYETSPYAQRMLAMNKESGLDAASQMGLLGSSGALRNIQIGAGDIVSRDRQQYLQDLMQKYLSGIGIGQSIYSTGAQVGANLGSQAMENAKNMAGLEYGRTNAPGQLFGNLLGTAANAAANYFAPGSGTIGA